MAKEKSGVHITGADSGWPVGAASEPPYRKAGNGTDVVGHDVTGVAGGVVTDQTSANEVQRITFGGTVSGGTFQVTFAGQQTAALPFSCTAAALQSALENLSNVVPGDVLVTGGPAPGTPLTITYKGQYTDLDEPQITVQSALTGTAPTATPSTVTPGSP